jgi:Fe-S cluster assembly protein SufD
VTIAVIKTKAETSLCEQFAANANRLPGGSATLAARTSAIARFQSLGLPHRRVEAWKYTDLRAALKDAVAPAFADDTNVSLKDLDAALGPLAHVAAHRIVFVNGAYRAELSSVTKTKGIDVQPLSADWSRLDDHRTNAALQAESVVALNTAFVTDGAVVQVGAEAALQKPVMIVQLSAGRDAKLATTRNVVSVGAAAAATIIEVFASIGGNLGQSNALTDIIVGAKAHVAHHKVSVTPVATHLATSSVSLGADATYRAFQLTSSTGLARNQIFLTFAGENSKIDISGLMLGRGRDHIDTTLVIDHAVPHCESRELFRTVLDDHARSVFQGKVIVRPGAQKTDGKQMANALMLSEHAEFDSKPELEIYADDVVCGHGATCIELNKDLLFYMRARGLPLADARTLLIESFAGEALDRVEDEAIRAALGDITSAWLSASGSKA